MTNSSCISASRGPFSVDGHADAKIAFSWNGLPQYAARLIRAAIDCLEEPCAIVGSPPNVPVAGMENVLCQRVHWLDARKPATWEDLNLSIPSIFVQSGWSYPAFVGLGRQVKEYGGHVIGLSDANWRGDMRQIILGPIGFRLCHRNKFDAIVVPGRQGERLMRYFGVPASRVRHGMYAADETIFSAGPPLINRPKEFLFVGQFIQRKNVLGLAHAFVQFAKNHKDWNLRLIGSGVLREKIPDHPQIIIEDFVQPENLAKHFHKARYLVLPSRREAWGLVVHEAALCGCALLLSDRVGASDDLSTDLNTISFRVGSEGNIVDALCEAAKRNNDWLARAESESIRLASRISPQRFAHEIAALVKEFRSWG